MKTHRVGLPISLPPEPAINSSIACFHATDSPKTPDPIASIAITPDGKPAYETDGYAVIPVDLVHHRAERAITGFDDALSIAIAPDGETAGPRPTRSAGSQSERACV